MKNIRITWYAAFFANPNVGHFAVDVKEGLSYSDDGFEISADHQYITVHSFPGKMIAGEMLCDVMFKRVWYTKILNFITGKPLLRLASKDILEPTKLEISKIYCLSFNNGYDDSCYSFDEISEAEVLPDTTMRQIPTFS